MKRTMVTAITTVAEADLIAKCRAALDAATGLEAASRAAVARRVTRDGRVDPACMDQQQRLAHGYAWLATYACALDQMAAWATRLEAGGRFTWLEAQILRVAFAEYLAQLVGGIAMSQSEIVRPQDLGVDRDAIDRVSAAAAEFSADDLAAARADIAAAAGDGRYGDPAFDDSTLKAIGEQFRRFADDRIVADADRWHRDDVLIDDGVVEAMAGMGVFGLTMPESFGGAGLGKVAMCLVTEELSRGFLGAGSLSTRSEIAAELVLNHGTDAQKARWLPGIVGGTILPTAAFTEPDVGSDLGNLKTRAVRDRDVYRVTGAKTWMTHGGRADVMTLLARTGPQDSGYRGLSMFLAPKPRGTEDDPFPATGMSGSEIRVLGYRGMKEYAVGFDGFAVAADGLLGGIEGQGFKQLMAGFETARIQTAARAVGVAQSALELAAGYAGARHQFGRPIAAFPRVADKLAWMAVETMIARQLTWYAAREKDSGHRCDLQAGMAKLLAARVAWSGADSAVQIHGGNGYAEEYSVSRVLVDARILNIFEGAAEIQAHIIARRLFGGN